MAEGPAATYPAAVGAGQRRGVPAWSWRSFSRFVEVYPVATGWLVLWGRIERSSGDRTLLGNRVYADLAGVRGRVVDAVLDLTNDASLAHEARVLLERARLPERAVAARPGAL